ncbi:MAG: OmpA family protein, partial [Aureibaculum sp.]
KILQEHPTMVIEAGSHTDSNNTEAYNQVLSENRAKAVKEYMITRGIEEVRIISKGYGEMKLTNKCSSFVKCTPEEHQANRRTEFKIVKM